MVARIRYGLALSAQSVGEVGAAPRAVQRSVSVCRLVMQSSDHFQVGPDSVSGISVPDGRGSVVPKDKDKNNGND